MQERLQKILKNILDWWNKFSTKQKTFIVAAAAGVIIAVAVIASVLTRPQYVLLLQCDTTRKPLRYQIFWTNRDWIIRYQMMATGSRSTGNSSRRQIFCLEPMISRRQPIPLTM